MYHTIIWMLRCFNSYYLCVRSRFWFSYLSRYSQLQCQVENSQMISGGQTLCSKRERNSVSSVREREREREREKNVGQSENYLWKALSAFFWYSSCIPRRDAVKTGDRCEKMVRIKHKERKQDTANKTVKFLIPKC